MSYAQMSLVSSANELIGIEKNDHFCFNQSKRLRLLIPMHMLAFFFHIAGHKLL
jgi:hypothetical protein